MSVKGSYLTSTDGCDVLEVMKRYILSLLGTAVALFLVVSPVLGITYPQGEQHYYSVFLRGNGEAVVSFKAHFSNLSDQPVQSVALSVPQGIVSDVSAYQVDNYQFNPNPCYPSYSPQPVVTPYLLEKQSSQGTSSSGSSAPIPESGKIMAQEGIAIMPCRGFPDANGLYTLGQQYEKADVLVNGQALTVSLPSTVAPGEDGNYFLTYRLNGLVHKTFLGANKFAFKTMRVAAPVSDIQIGIATDENYLLKDAEGNINYNGSVGMKAAEPMVTSSTGVSNAALDTYYNQIGQGTLYKTASHLSPEETYSVDGVYADSSWKFYGKEISIGIALLILLGIGIVLLTRLGIHRFRAWGTTNDTKLLPTVHRVWQRYPLLVTLGVSFTSAVVALVYTGILFFLGGFITSGIAYSSFMSVLFILIIVSSFGIYGVVLIVPAIVIGVKRSLGWGITTFCFTVAWVGFFATVLFLVLLVFSRQPPMQVYPMSGGVMTPPAAGANY